MSQFLVIFAAVFVAELGDKTQIATLLFAADRPLPPVLVFLAASAALVAATGLAVALGTAADRFVGALPLKPVAGVGFIAIGLWTLYRYFASA